MRKKSISRLIMLIAGFIAACAILLSPGFSQVKGENQVKAEKKTESQAMLVQAPADAIPGSAVKMDTPSIPVLSEIEEIEKKTFFPEINSREVTKYIKIMLRTLIAPNAP